VPPSMRSLIPFLWAGSWPPYKASTPQSRQPAPSIIIRARWACSMAKPTVGTITRTICSLRDITARACMTVVLPDPVGRWTIRVLSSSEVRANRMAISCPFPL